MVLGTTPLEVGRASLATVMMRALQGKVGIYVIHAPGFYFILFLFVLIHHQYKKIKKILHLTKYGQKA